MVYIARRTKFPKTHLPSTAQLPRNKTRPQTEERDFRNVLATSALGSRHSETALRTSMAARPMAPSYLGPRGSRAIATCWPAVRRFPLEKSEKRLLAFGSHGRLIPNRSQYLSNRFWFLAEGFCRGCPIVRPGFLASSAEGIRRWNVLFAKGFFCTDGQSQFPGE